MVLCSHILSSWNIAWSSWSFENSSSLLISTFLGFKFRHVVLLIKQFAHDLLMIWEFQLFERVNINLNYPGFKLPRGVFLAKLALPPDMNMVPYVTTWRHQTMELGRLMTRAWMQARLRSSKRNVDYRSSFAKKGTITTEKRANSTSASAGRRFYNLLALKTQSAS